MSNMPIFGHGRRADFLLADGIAHLNHGGYGATPRIVLEAAERWRRLMEADPSAFFRRELRPRLREAAAAVAEFLGGRGEDWVFLENATAGLNAVIASLPLAPGDELLCLSQAYPAVVNATRHHAARAEARVIIVPVPVPFTDPALLFAALAERLGPRTRLAVLDHVTSAAAAVLPIGEMARICRDAGVPVAIDGAHAPGMLPLDIPSLGVDWYVGNLHKWAFAPKGTGVLWCAPERQAQLHPVAISNYLGEGFTTEFDYCGTRDNSAALAAPAAIAYLEAIGPEAVRARNDALARAAGEMLAAAWGTEAAASPAYSAAMVSVRLPQALAADGEGAARLALQLTEDHRISVGVTVLAGALWLRLSAQIYNELEDYVPLAAIGPKLTASGGRP
jgi:isopenicillin-N epimerase